MNFTLEKTSDGRFVAQGMLSFATARDALRMGEQTLEPRQDAVVELSGLERVDSAGLAVLIEWFSWFQSADHQLTLEAVPRQLCDLARISELDELLGMTERMADHQSHSSSPSPSSHSSSQ